MTTQKWKNKKTTQKQWNYTNRNGKQKYTQQINKNKEQQNWHKNNNKAHRENANNKRTTDIHREKAQVNNIRQLKIKKVKRKGKKHKTPRQINHVIQKPKNWKPKKQRQIIIK